MSFLKPSLPLPDWKGTIPEPKYLATDTELKVRANMTTSYLATTSNFGDPPFSRLNELKNWLRGYVTAPDFFSKKPCHALDDLHNALLAATKEISMKLDPELEATIHAAGEDQHSIECDEDAFWASRVLDVHKLYTTGLIGIKTLHRERVISLLLIARDEVQWLTNEIRRLEVHCKNAQELKSCKNREKFVYYPWPRNELPDELKGLNGAGIMVSVEGRGVDVDDVLEEGEIKDEDEEMIDAERRDSKEVATALKKEKENLDYMEL